MFMCNPNVHLVDIMQGPPLMWSICQLQKDQDRRLSCSSERFIAHTHTQESGQLAVNTKMAQDKE